MGARVRGPAGMYLGVLTGGRSRGPLAALQDTQAKPSLAFYVDERGRVFLGDTELDVEDLREVVKAADAAAKSTTKGRP